MTVFAESSLDDLNNQSTGTCPDPAIENGEHDQMESAWFHWTHPLLTTLHFICDDGYELQGPKNATCQLNGTWTQVPECVGKLYSLEKPTAPYRQHGDLSILLGGFTRSLRSTILLLTVLLFLTLCFEV